MRTDLFDFELPEALIALRPVHPRDAARLLVVRPDGPELLADHVMTDLPSLIAPGDALVFNDTRVIPAALTGVRTRGEATAHISANLIERLDDHRWQALVRPAKRLEPATASNRRKRQRLPAGDLDATVEAKGEGGAVTLCFDLSGPALHDAIEAQGAMPLPPYIAARRTADEQDRSDYQTTFAREEGAVAAPTAGLHFTGGLIEALEARGNICFS